MEGVLDFIIVGFERYYGLDWLAMSLTIFSIHYLGKKNVIGFLFAGVACLCWLAFNALAESMAGILANVVFIIMNVKAYKSWKKEEIN